MMELGIPVINDVSEERYDFLGTDLHYGSGFDPFGEYIDNYE
jgi:hypothetical protein